jgi:type VII secretion-associated serine protease mycosin
MYLRKFLAFGLSILSVLAFSSPASADSIRDRQYWISDYGFNKVWEVTKGAGVKVAVIDTGVDAQHPDLEAAMFGGTDVSSIGDPSGYLPVGEVSHHGTMVASLLAGRGHGDGEGVIGVAPEAELLSVSMAFGAETLNTDDQVAAGIKWAVDAGAKVINLSLTRNSKDWPLSWDEAFLYAFENDVVVVAAAGNRADGTEQVGAPATIPGVLVVAGVDRDAVASTAASTAGLSISVAAPATDLVSAFPGGDYKIWSGSSGAAPIVSGLVALVRAKYPELDANNVINRIIETATQVGDDNYSPDYGFGLIDPQKALSAKVALVKENPLGSLSQWIELYRKSQAPEDVPSGTINTPIDSVEPVVASGPDSGNLILVLGYLAVGAVLLSSMLRGSRRRE